MVPREIGFARDALRESRRVIERAHTMLEREADLAARGREAIVDSQRVLTRFRRAAARQR
jgi:hypothetical protein